jgi:soluble lytic murein transglycosylase
MRAAKRVGDDRVAIVKACIAAEAKSAKGGALLDAVSTEARIDLGYMLCRLHWLTRNRSISQIESESHGQGREIENLG